MIVDDYERSGAAVKLGTAKKPDPGGIAQYFADQSAAQKFQGEGVGAPLGCGVASDKDVVDGAVIGTPVLSQNTISVPVALYVGTRRAAQVDVTADGASGKLTGFSCGSVTAPEPPGAHVLVNYYGGYVAIDADPAAKEAIKELKKRYLAPGFASWDWPGLRAEASTCADDDPPTYWHAVYAPESAATGGAQWYFWPAGSDSQISMSAAVDSLAGRVGWVFCFGQLVAQATPAAYSEDQIQSYINDLFNDYSYLLALHPVGADASVISAYFVSPDAYQAAATSTGPLPLECSQTPAGSIGADSVSVSGGTATIALTASPLPHPVGVGETPLGHLRVVLDTASMKIKSVTCG
jgi:hypothetical protein